MSGYFLYRAAVVRYIDRLFYEEGNRQRCHSRCHKLLIRQLCGIGDNTYWNYRHLPEPIVAEYALRPDIKMLLRLQVLFARCRCYPNDQKRKYAAFGVDYHHADSIPGDYEAAPVRGRVTQLAVEEKGRFRPFSVFSTATKFS